MKRSAEGELARLEVPRTREEIEQDLDDPRTPANMKNEKLPYVLVTYLRNVEKLAEMRRQEVERVAAETKAKADALKAEVQTATANGGAETKTVTAEKADAPAAPQAAVQAPASAPKAPAPEGIRVVDTPLDREETISKNFIAANRKEIDELI